MTPILTRIKQEQDESLLRIRNLIMSGFRDLLFGDTAASIPAVDFAEEPRTQPSARMELPPLAKVMDRTGSLRRKGPGSKRTPEALAKLTTSLASYIFRNPGQRIEQIAKGMGISTKELMLPAKKLIAEKAVKTKGQRRATVYMPGAKAAR